MLPRQKLILEFWDRSKVLSVNHIDYRNFVIKLFSLLYKSDGKNNDLTTNSLIENNKKASALITAKEGGILAGIEELKLLNKDLKIIQFKNDGSMIKNGDAILEMSGNAKTILQRERVNLNLLHRMCGAATLAYNLNKKLKNKIKLAATRKTAWGLLDKKAVSIGNGLTHRLNLSDGIVVKDNHLKIINYNFKKAVNSVKNKSKYVEIEVEDKKQALEAAAAIKSIIKKSKKNNSNIFAIMLDKIQPNEIKLIIRELKKRDLYDFILLEASGNITPANLQKYSDCGADIISMGCITNSAKALNMSLEIR